MLYSVFGNIGIDFDFEVIIVLLCYFNIIGLKDSGGDVSVVDGDWFYLFCFVVVC